MRVLLTGGAGFIGSNLVRYLRRERPRWRILNLDLLTYAGNPENLKDVPCGEGYGFVHGDIQDAPLLGQLLSEHHIEAVLALAAESHVDRSIHDSRSFIRTNVLGTHTLLEAVRAHPQVRFVQVSTDEVYGPAPDGVSFEETSILSPTSPYAASKAAADHLVLAFHKTYGLDTLITRCTNNYGPYQFPEKLIPVLTMNALEGRHLPLYGDGLQRRDWIHVEDHCAGILAALEHGRSGAIYNLGSDAERTNLSLAREILSILGASDKLIRFVADRPAHDRRYAVDTARAHRELFWHPRRDFELGLTETIRWYAQNRGWWERITSGAYRQYQTPTPVEAA